MGLRDMAFGVLNFRGLWDFRVIGCQGSEFRGFRVPGVSGV